MSEKIDTLKSLMELLESYSPAISEANRIVPNIDSDIWVWSCIREKRDDFLLIGHEYFVKSCNLLPEIAEAFLLAKEDPSNAILLKELTKKFVKCVEILRDFSELWEREQNAKR